MRITLEADYAVRIIDRLATVDGRLDARSISESTGVTLRFTLKILRKLSLAGVVKSYKGVTGGYALAKTPDQINLRQVIEAVDGPIEISRCLANATTCSNVDDKKMCYYHNVFAELSKTIRVRLESVTFEDKQGD